MIKEKDLINKVKTWWENKGALILKFHGNQFTRQGIPDLIICYKGNFIAIEVKIGNNKPTPIQLEMINRIKEWYDGQADWVNEKNWEEKSKTMYNKIEEEELINDENFYELKEREGY